MTDEGEFTADGEDPALPMTPLDEAMRDLETIEGCSTCEWRGSYQELLKAGGHDTCPDGCGDGTMTTYYGPDRLQEHELELHLAEQATVDARARALGNLPLTGIEFGRSPEMARLSRDHSPAGEFSIHGAAEDGEFRPIDIATLDAYASNFGHSLRGGWVGDVRTQLGLFVHAAIPAHVVVVGLVLDGAVYTGWRRWALRLGMWLVRKSGCEVVKP